MVALVLVGALVAIAGLYAGGSWLSGWACRNHEAREGRPAQPEGRVVGMAHVSFSPKADAVFDPLDPRYQSYRVVRRVPSRTPAGTVLEVSGCAPFSLWGNGGTADFYLTVSNGKAPLPS